jgi:hypothetical protein
MSRGQRGRALDALPRRILAGSGEKIFEALPARVLENLRKPASENALLWNLIYPLARPRLSLSDLLSLRPLWGTAIAATDLLEPYFWGLDLDGRPLEGLAESVRALGGREHTTEVDLFLVGADHLVLVEAKHLSSLGRCGRYARGRCPEVHPADDLNPCRYWEVPEARFDAALDFGVRPGQGEERPPCSVHYQLGRTLLLARRLGERLGRVPHLWLITPASRWGRVEPAWIDFADRVRDPEMWRRLRVIAWESVRDLAGR